MCRFLLYPEAFSFYKPIPRTTLAECGFSSHDELDDRIDAWHDGGSGVPLAEYLGMTFEEYATVVLRCPKETKE